MARVGEEVSVAVRDEGVGLPPGFDLEGGKGLGMRLVKSFTMQLSGSASVRDREPGTEFVITFPMDTGSPGTA